MSAPPARLQLAGIFLAYTVAGVYWGAAVASFPAFEATAGLGPAAFGALLTSQTVGGILVMQALGRVLHRVQAWAIPAALAGMAAGMTVLSQAGGPVGLGAGLFLVGGASGALDISLNMRVARIEADLGLRLFNRVHAVFPFAMLVSSAATGALRDLDVPPSVIFPAIALAFLAAAALERRAGRHQQPGPGRGTGGPARLRPVVWLLGALAAMGAMMEGGAHTWSAIFVEGELGGSPTLGGLSAAAITLGLTVGRLAAHRAEGQLRDMQILGRFALVAVPGFLLLAGAGAAGASPLLALAGFFLAGVGIGPVEPAVFRSVAKRHAEADRGRALALATGLAYTGYLTAPPGLGWAIGQFGWAPMFGVLAAAALTATALAARVPPADPGAR